MAGPETVHLIVEKIDIQGAEEAYKVFKVLSGSAKGAGKSFQEAMRAAGKMGDAVQEAAKKAKKGHDEAAKKTSFFQRVLNKVGEEAKEGWGKFAKGQIVAEVIMGAFRKVVEILGALIAKAWEAAKVFEAMRDRTKGMVMGLFDLGKGGPMEQVAKSTKAANILMTKFHDIAMKTATPAAKIEEAFAAISPTLAGMGKSALEVTKATEAAAGAAKVFGADSSMAAQIFAKSVSEGTVEGEGPLAAAIKAQIGDKAAFAKLDQTKRLEKMQAIFEALAAPVGEVTKNTESALARWDELANGILKKVALPVYEKFGEVVAWVVKKFEENEGTINAITDAIQEAYSVINSVATAVWDVTVGVIEADKWFQDITGQSRIMEGVWSGLKAIGGEFLDIVEAIAVAWRVVVEGVRVMADPTRGMGKLNALTDALSLKFYEVLRAIGKVVDAISQIIIPEWAAKKIPGVDKFLQGIKNVNSTIDTEIAARGIRLRKAEEAAGLGPLTSTTRGLAREAAGIGISKADADRELAGLRGRKIQVTQNIAKLEVKQDFRDADPDRVIIDFVRGLERLGENALQSSVAGSATAFGPG